MKLPWIAGAAFTILLVALAPERDEAPLAVDREEASPPLATVLRVLEPASEPQLLDGWHRVEEAQWRWTRRRFRAVLRPPEAGRDATLRLHFELPAALVERLGSIRIAAIVSGHSLPARYYNREGQHVYEQKVPLERLSGEAVVAEFVLDKALEPTPDDPRELGILVSQVGLY